KQFVRFAERIVDRRQEHAALQIDHRVFHAISSAAYVHSAAGIAVREVRWTKQPWLIWHEFDNFAAIPAVITPGDHLHAIFQKFFDDFRSDSEAGGGVFAVRNHQINAFLRNQIGEAVANNFAARRTNDVSDEEYAHREVGGSWGDGGEA